MVITLTTDNFDEEVLKAEQPVLVDFWASWCGPCQKMAPIVEEVSEQTAGIKVCKVNVDEQNDLAGRYGIMSIPTLILFRNGKATGQSVGMVSKKEILSMLE